MRTAAGGARQQCPTAGAGRSLRAMMARRNHKLVYKTSLLRLPASLSGAAGSSSQRQAPSSRAQRHPFPLTATIRRLGYVWTTSYTMPRRAEDATRCIHFAMTLLHPSIDSGPWRPGLSNASTHTYTCSNSAHPSGRRPFLRGSLQESFRSCRSCQELVATRADTKRQ